LSYWITPLIGKIDLQDNLRNLIVKIDLQDKYNLCTTINNNLQGKRNTNIFVFLVKLGTQN